MSENLEMSDFVCISAENIHSSAFLPLSLYEQRGNNAVITR